MKRLWIMFALIMLFAIGPPMMSAAPTNTVKSSAKQIADAPNPAVALGGATTFIDSELVVTTKNVLMTSGVTSNTFSSTTMYNGLPALVSTTSTDNQSATNQKALPATNKKRDVRAHQKKLRGRDNPEGRHRLTAARNATQQINDDGRHNTNRQQLIS